MNLEKRLEHVRRTAARTAARLIRARGQGPQPKTGEEFMRLIEMMLRAPKRWGVTVMPWEKRAVLRWHALQRLTCQKPVSVTNGQGAEEDKTHAPAPD